MGSRVADPAAILFDLDGTLVDTVNQRVWAWIEAFAEIGIAANRDLVGPYMGADGRRVAREVAKQSGHELDRTAVEALDRRAGDLFGRLNRQPAPHAGVTALLDALEAAGLPWAIATSSRGEQVHASTRALGLASPRVTDGSSVRHAKPDPELLLAGAALVGQPPDRCWYVGDATWDMLAAKAADMAGIGVASGHASQSELRLAGAHWTVERMAVVHAELRRRGVVAG